MVKVIWTRKSLKDLEDIGEYISQGSVKYAKRTLEKIIATSSLIEINPFMGRIVPEINDNLIREFIKGNYRIIYQIRDTATFILTIHHSARNLTDEIL